VGDHERPLRNRTSAGGGALDTEKKETVLCERIGGGDSPATYWQKVRTLLGRSEVSFQSVRGGAEGTRQSWKETIVYRRTVSRRGTRSKGG